MVRTRLVQVVQIVMALSVMVDWTAFSITGFIVPLNLQYAAVILFHRPVLRWIGVDVTDAQSLLIGLGMALHPLGMVYDLYSRFWFWDHMTHFYSGVLLTSAFLVCLWWKDVSNRNVVLYSLLLVLAASGLWELFEFFISTNLTTHGPHDAGIDTAFNLLGWLTMLVFGRDWLENVTDQITVG